MALQSEERAREKLNTQGNAPYKEVPEAVRFINHHIKQGYIPSKIFRQFLLSWIISDDPSAHLVSNLKGT